MASQNKTKRPTTERGEWQQRPTQNRTMKAKEKREWERKGGGWELVVAEQVPRVKPLSQWPSWRGRGHWTEPGPTAGRQTGARPITCCVIRFMGADLELADMEGGSAGRAGRRWGSGGQDPGWQKIKNWSLEVIDGGNLQKNVRF